MCLYFCRRHEQAVKENIHFKKRQSWQEREESRIKDRILSFTQICAIEQSPWTDPSNPKERKL